MSKITGLRCTSCKRVYSPDSGLFTCPVCGPYKGTLEVLYDYDAIGKKFNRKNWIVPELPGHYRYIKLLPFEDTKLIPPLLVGYTPLIKSEFFEKKYHIKGLYLKDDTREPTLSYKDRASSIAAIKAKEANANGIIVASTGNAASSMAGFGASIGMPVYVLAPRSIPEGKLLQLLLFNAKVILIDGNYDTSFDLSLKVAEKTGLYLRSTAVNPYLSEGKKTAAFEIAEQLEYNMPSYVFVPVGDGCIIESVYKGFNELKRLGFIEKIPHMVGVQAEKSAPLVRAYENNTDEIEFIENPETVADSINVGVPRDGVKALKSVKESNGFFIGVSDEEILEAISELAKYTGIFTEPAAGAAFAGFKKAIKENRIPHDATCVILLTGNGLKDPRAIKRIAKKDVPVVSKEDLDTIVDLIRF